MKGVYTKMEDQTFKIRLNYIMETNKNTIEHSKSRQTCTAKSEKSLKKQLKEIKTSKLTKRFERWIIYCVEMQGKCKPNMLLIRNTEDSTKEKDERAIEKEIGLVYYALFQQGLTKEKDERSIERKIESFYGALV